MAKKGIMTELTEDLVTFLEGEKLVMLATIDHESHTPNVSAISWVKSLDKNNIRFSVTSNSRTIQNVKQHSNVVFTIIGLETVYSIHGKASILEEAMQGVSLKLAKINVEVTQVVESMFWGAKITAEPQYEKTYNQKKAEALDEEVYEALLK
ncbi:pyridoxamine 5'-phosphate oxidase family protein [Guptibacillus hwajinpoensis]|uniref:pyridoxamine 5'-phosphate oxidase family protein n=1 Tax=Guptibacillus hwajinpoensis TaxID=208199 RepID=UPI001CFEC9DB|nr:pyridoxamine 5'-phosphate oxidase family protein [Pseudalkalibacillus hwajinpoensis]WLR59447.1 pyridoxamine 5'-phosphate oxidase family protein [Pseudalkalibacillus hwajinpoensis]